MSTLLTVRRAPLALAPAAVLAAIAIAVPRPALAGGAADTVAPMIGEHTVFVGLADLSQIDPVAAGEWFIGNLVKAGLPAEMAGQMRMGLGGAQMWRTGFLGTGATHIGMVGYERPDDPGDDDLIPALIVPLPDGADPAVIANLLQADEGRWFVKDGLFVAVPGHEDWMPMAPAKNVVPKARPAITAGLAEVGDAPAWMVFAPTQAYRAGMLERMNDEFVRESAREDPDDQMEARFIEMAMIVMKAEWSAWAVDQPAPPKARAMSQMADAADAARFTEALDEMRALLAKYLNADEPGMLRGEMGIVATLTMATNVIQWDQQGARLTATADGEQIDFAMFAPMIQAARAEAQQAQRGTLMRQAVLGCIMYETDHNTWPKSLNDIGPYVGDIPLDNYEYIRPSQSSAQMQNAGSRVLVHQAFDAWPAEGVVTGFVDGHVETIRNQQRFDRLIKEARSWEHRVPGF